MNGAQVLLQTLIDADIDVCFCNPGTSEMHFVAALDQQPAMRCVLGLFEGVVSGAADGYARMAGKPAVNLLHLGPGLSNALANIHNARRAHVPMINVIGDHARYHKHFDAPLNSDIETLARPMSDWVSSCNSSDDVASEAAEAIFQANSGSGQIASLILPADSSWNKTSQGPLARRVVEPPATVSDSAIDAAAAALTSGEPCMVLIGGHVSPSRLQAAARIASHAAARLACETFPTRLCHGGGTAVVERIPYLAEWALEVLKDIKHVILVGCRAPVSFFAYPQLASDLLPADCQRHSLAAVEQDIDDALARLQQLLGAEQAQPALQPLSEHALPSGALNGESIAQSIAAQIPADTIVVDEGIVGGISVFPMTETAPPHEWLSQTGGSIGWGLPAAVGAAIACPDRKVLCLEGDGSAMYTIQALWTMAREQLDIVVVIFANRQYAILQMEYARVGVDGAMGDNARRQMDIGNPDMDFVAMAQSMGVQASRAETAEQFNTQLAAAFACPGPVLIEAVI